MLRLITKATIMDVIAKMLVNGPDNPQPKVIDTLREQCRIPLNAPEIDRTTYSEALDWFEENDLFTYDDVNVFIWKKLFERVDAHLLKQQR